MLGGLAAIACVMWRMTLLWRQQHRYASFHDHQGAPVPVGEGDVSLQKLELGKRRKSKGGGGVGAASSSSSVVASASKDVGAGGGGVDVGGIPSTEAVKGVGAEEEEEIALPDLEGQDGGGAVVGVRSGVVSIS